MVEMNSLDSEKEKSGYDPFASPPTSVPMQPPPTTPPQQQYQQPPSHGPPGGDIMESMLASVNQDLLISKTFYFFFFSAFGSLFPLMGIFFKQLGMNPVQCGLLVGFRPFVEFLSAPFWGTIADQFRKGKLILLMSLISWLVFTLSLVFIKPPPESCIISNATHHFLKKPEDISLIKREAPSWLAMADNDSSLEIEDPPEDRLLNVENSYRFFFSNRFKRNSPTHLPPGYVIGQSPGPVHYSSNYDPNAHNTYIKPVFSKIVYKKADVKRVFFMLLLIVVIGEFFSAPAITLADSVTLTYLGENANNYGRQRMFGSLGWGLAMFFVGIALDHSTAFPSHPCGPHEYERNYTICFAVFSVLMGCAFITATQFRFDYDAYDDSIPLKSMPQEQPMTAPTTTSPTEEKEPNHFAPECNNVPNIQEYSNIENEAKTEKSKVFASTTTRVPEWLRVLRTFANLRYGAFLFVAWFMGFGIGLVFTFLFWHLQDLGGSPTLFGVASVINHISEIFAYFFSFRLIKQIGHVKVLCLGLIGNVARFLYVSWLTHPWWVLPFELIQGITHAAVWAACCSYITQATPMNLRSSAQGVLQGLHHGLGRGCGAVLGGLLATYQGTAITFRVYGFLCAIVLVAFILINFYHPDEGFTTASDEPHQVLEDNYHLDPHGVPSSPMPRVLSSSRLEQLNGGGGGGGTYRSLETHTTGGFLDIPKGGGGGGGGGGFGGGGGNEGAWTQIGSAVYSGHLHGNHGTRARKSLASAFQLKGSPVTSPEAVFDYDFIRNDFQAYSDVLFACNAKDDDASNGNIEPLKAPLPIMALHNPQPETRQFQAVYDW